MTKVSISTITFKRPIFTKKLSKSQFQKKIVNYFWKYTNMIHNSYF